MSMIPKGDRLGAAIIVVDAIGATLAVIAVSLRLWARRIQRSNLGPSDYSIIIALVSFSTKPEFYQMTEKASVFCPRVGDIDYSE